MTEKQRAIRRRILILCLLAALFILLLILLSSMPNTQDSNSASLNSELRVTVIDVGQADSILITLATGEVMLIDAGEKSGVNEVFQELDELEITRIDILVATHPHADHIGGMASIIEKYEISAIYMSDEKADTKTYKNLIKTINKNSIPIIEAYAGLTFEFGNAMCQIVSPQKNTNANKNNESVVVFLDYYDTEFLFAGDMEEEAEQVVLESGYNVDADVLKVAHHGSYSSTSEDFLSAVSPDYAAISCDGDNKYGHPHIETIELLTEYGLEIYQTDLDGDIMFLSDGYNIEVLLGDNP